MDQNESSGVLGRVQNALIRSIYQISDPTFWDFVLNKIFFTKQDPGPRSYPRVSSLAEPEKLNRQSFQSPAVLKASLCSLTKSKNGPNSSLVALICHFEISSLFCVNDRGTGSFQLV